MEEVEEEVEVEEERGGYLEILTPSAGNWVGDSRNLFRPSWPCYSASPMLGHLRGGAGQTADGRTVSQCAAAWPAVRSPTHVVPASFPHATVTTIWGANQAAAVRRRADDREARTRVSDGDERRA